MHRDRLPRIVLCTPLLCLCTTLSAADGDADGVDDEIDVCCNTPAGIRVDAQGRPLGDFDEDCDVDQSDFAVFQLNMTAPMSCAPEVCDNFDNDCNCVIDDANALTCGVGACYREVAGCADGVPQTCVPGQPSPEICSDGVDNDCDGLTDCADVASCPDGTACDVAGRACQAGACSCASGFVDCDGQAGNGCEINLNANPTCGGTLTQIGSISGDTGAAVVSRQARGESWFSVRLIENNSGDVYLSARVTLTVPTGADYDLYIYCFNCGGAPVASSAQTGSGTEVVYARAEDDWGESDDHDIVIEVRYRSGSACENYQLDIAGNVGVSTPTCNP